MHAHGGEKVPVGINSFTTFRVPSSRMMLVLMLLGAGLLHAQDDTLDSKTLRTNPDVALAAGNSLAFSQQPTNAPAAAPIVPSVTIQLKDNSGKNLLQAGVSVTMALSTGTGTLAGTTTRTTNAQGVATFDSLRIDLTGAKQLKATATGFTAATSNAFTITPGPAARVRVQTEPSATATAGVAFAQQPVIWIEDASGNRVTTDNSTVVTAERFAGAGDLQGILSITAISGVATFSNLSHNIANTISIRFRSGTLTTDTSRSILISAASAARLAFLENPSDALAGSVIVPPVTVGLTDAFGNAVSTTGTQISIALSSGSGVLSGTLARSTSSGIATFNNLSINLAGSKILRATSGTLTAAVSNTFTISPRAAKTLIFLQQPTDATAGAPISPAVTIQARDSLGNNAAAPGVPVTVGISSGTGTLGGTAIRTTNTSGLATFDDLSINLIGSKTLSASAPSLTSAVSTAFTIVVGTATQVVFVQQPTNTKAGATISPALTVQLKDALGNNVRAAGVSVSISITSGTGTLTGTSVQLTDAAGIATFNNLSVNLSGTKRFTASGTGLTSSVSDAFSITAAAASKLVFVANPGGAVAGIPFGTQPVVALVDAFGNVVNNTAQTVTLAIQNNAGPGGNLVGTKSIVLDQATGLAAFSGLAIEKTGNGYTLTATGSTVSTAPGTVISAPFSVTANTAAQVRVENAADGSGTAILSQNVTSGTSITLYAIARDAYTNFVANIPADTWTVGNITGSVLTTDLVPGADRKSAVFTGRLAGSAVISAIAGNLTSLPSGTLTVVVAGSASQIRVESAANGTGTVVSDRTVSSGSTVTVYAVGRDAAGNFISNIAAESWSLQNKTGGVGDGDLVASIDKKSATYTARLIGTTRIRATLGTLTAISSGILTVTAGPATVITATAGTPQSTRAGAAFPTRFGARVKDVAGNPVQGVTVSWAAPVSGPSGTFSADGSAATTDSTGTATSGVFTANNIAGTFTVVASIPQGVATGAYSLTITVGTAARIATAAGSPQSTSISKQYPSPLQAIVSDSSGNAVSGVSVTFTAPSTGPSGTFSSGGKTLVVATNPSGIASAPSFVANSIAGTFQVVATAAGVVSSAVFELRNTAGVTHTVTTNAGTPQSTIVGESFAVSPSAMVTDSAGNPLWGILVTFTTPPTGASARFAGGLVDTIVTDGTGIATATTLIANKISGPFTLLAQVQGVSTPASFLLTNLPGPVDTFLVDASGGGQIGTQTANIPFNIRIRAYDEYGNATPSFNGTVDISSNGNLSQAGVSTAPFVAGVLASHTVSMQNAGRFVIKANRTGGAETGRSDTFAVNNPIPSLTRLSPAIGLRGQTLSITVIGSGFLPGVTRAAFGDLISTSTTVTSGTELTVTISIDTAATPGVRDVFVFNGPPGGGTGILAGAFVIGNNPLPHLFLVTPDSGIILQRMNLECTGNNFLNGITRLHAEAGIIVNATTVTSSTLLTADISITGLATGGMQSVFVSNDPPGGGNSESRAFHVVTPPTPFPTLDSPADAALGADTAMTFRWHPWLNTGILYRFQMSTDVNFATTIVDDSTIADTSKRVTSLVPGATYYWRVLARNLLGTSSPSPARSFKIPIQYPQTYTLADTIWYPTYSSRSEYHSGDYRLVGIPGNKNASIGTLLQGSRHVDWEVFWDNGYESNYLVPFDETNTFDATPGRAFWILRIGSMSINTSVPTVPLDSLHFASISLHPGWNLITNPFSASIPWSAVQSANTPGIIPDIWAYNGTFTRSAVFTPCVGYLFDNPDSRTTLRVPFPGTVSKKPGAADSVLWRISIRLSYAATIDEATSIGVSSMAKNGRDPLDQRMPRGIGQEPVVFFDRPGWDPGGAVFATDIRKDIGTVETWPLSARVPVREPALLSFSGIGSVPSCYQVLLIDDERSRCVDLRESPAYRFVPATPLSHFRIAVGTQEATHDILADLLPKDFALGNNFPNPFNPSTTIPVAVPRTSTMALTVYSILGEEVATIFAGSLEPGRHWFLWSGRDVAGRPVSSGVYLIRLTVEGGKSLTGKMVLTR
jgi:hypothetical protein